ncbi:MAG TPA: ComF family protein [Candidatus Paceibacterota bacterium]|nr:ComF family protein [Candidatus Paceibacterota bacterium]HPT40310.1 ComF family protein [Candidatus Paceibacterota bacterium]
MFWLKAKNLILDSIFPIYCISCGDFLSSEKNSYLCSKCLAKIPINSGLFCPICFKRLDRAENKKCSHSAKKSFLDFLGYATYYEITPVKTLIHNYKYRFAKSIARTLSDIIIIYLKRSLNDWNNWVIIPIPLHRSRLNWRGFNQAEEIAKIINQKFNWPILNGILIRKKKTAEQAEIKKREKRQENLKDAFGLSPVKNSNNKSSSTQIIEGKKIILLDDVYTTGTTLEEAAKILKSAGAKKIIGLVIAK